MSNIVLLYIYHYINNGNKINKNTEYCERHKNLFKHTLPIIA